MQPETKIRKFKHKRGRTRKPEKSHFFVLRHIETMEFWPGYGAWRVTKVESALKTTDRSKLRKLLRRLGDGYRIEKVYS